MMPPDSPDAQVTHVAAGAQAATSAAAAMPLGVDTSHWQHTSDTAAIDWAQVRASGQSFAIMKATEGDYYSDPWMQRDMDAAHAAGLVVGAYHFARPSISAVAQADYFSNAIRSMPSPSLPPVLDLEVNGGLDVASLVTWTQTFLQRVQANTGTIPMIYTGPNFWRTSMGDSTAFAQYPLWEAHYTTAATPAAIGGWSTYTMWQFTSSASIPGIVGSVDQDRFNSSTGATLTNLHGPVGGFDSAYVKYDGTLTVSGWALDPDTATTPSTVHVYVDGHGQAVTANGNRPDIGQIFLGAGSAHGFTATAQVGPGAHNICVYAIDTTFADQHTGLGCRTVTLVPNLPLASWDSARVAGDGTLTVSGWALDPDTATTPSTVHVYVDGQGQAVTANGNRPDIGQIFPTAGSAHGFTNTRQVGPGSHNICVFAIDSTFGSLHSFLGCRTVTLVPNLPLASWDSARIAADGTLTVSGWAFDPDTPTSPSTVHVYVDGQGQAITANGNRPDIGRIFPTAGSAHGFTNTRQVGPGSHNICVFAIDSTFPSTNSFLGCRTVTLVPNLPLASWDSATVAADGTLTVSGWAFDPDTPTSPSTVHVYVDGQGQAITANGNRPDIGRIFPTAGSAHGFTNTRQVGPGSHNICVFAIDSTFGSLHSFLGCRTVTLVPNLPLASWDSATVAADGTLTVSGWAFDPDTPTAASSVSVSVDGVAQSVTANGNRPDIGRVFPAAGSAHGFTATSTLATGSHNVCVSAIDTSFADLHSSLGCRTVTH